MGRLESRLTFRSILIGTMLLALASCVGTRRPQRDHRPSEPAERPTPAPEFTSAVDAGVRPGPRLERLGVSPLGAAQALDAFRISCPDVTRRDDLSGLTRPADWAAACAAAASWPAADALTFFRTHFETAVVGEGRAFATGYYEPEISGCRTRQRGCEVPVYAKPPELLDTNPLTGERGRGRMDETGNYVLYHDRTEIEEGALAGRGLEIAWVADPVDLFFLQIQGSGRIRMSDGSVMRIGYAGQNGREYVALGRLMRERGILTSPITMQAITDWLRAHRQEGLALMRENKSYIFFTELTGPGPLGALGRPVTPHVSVAADPRFVPLGAPVVLRRMDNSRADGLWVAQDTGGAIRGANRFDTFWGAGAQAAAIAGGMSANGDAYLLLPRGALARIPADGPPPQR
jgi:membrane-bound lytic murein transglycosylase A